jgi:exonuclease III
MSKKEYTFDNGRSKVRSCVSRIDKFIVSQDLDTRGERIKAATLVRKLLNHSPLVLTIWG